MNGRPGGSVSADLRSEREAVVQVLQYLAQTHQELLSWHLKKHESSLSLCLQTIADHPFAPPGLGDEIYSSDEDEEQYLSEDDDEGFLDGRSVHTS